jgi:hypothetical protein
LASVWPWVIAFEHERWPHFSLKRCSPYCKTSLCQLSVMAPSWFLFQNV